MKALALTRWIGPVAALGLLALPAEAVRNCQSELTECRTRCQREATNVQYEANARDEALEQETQRFQQESQQCRELWQRARDYWTQEYGESLASCLDASCRQRALESYNLSYNGASIAEVACQERAYDVHRERMDAIEDRYTGVPTGPNPGYHYGLECKEECSNQSRECQDDTGDGAGEGDEAGMRLEPCPPGTRPTPLGVCMVRFQSQPASFPSEPGTCPEGSVPGPDDRCVPKTQIAGVVQSFGEWWLLCPEGTSPSPADGGCVPTLEGADGESAPGDVDRWCPPGMKLGPAGGCEPDVSTAPDGAGGVWNAMPVEDPELALELTESLLGARRVLPEAPTEGF